MPSYTEDSAWLKMIQMDLREYRLGIPDACKFEGNLVLVCLAATGGDAG